MLPTTRTSDAYTFLSYHAIGKPTLLCMSCHPTGPTMAAQPLPGLRSHAGFRKGYPPSLTCFLWCVYFNPPLPSRFLFLSCIFPFSFPFFTLLWILKFWKRNWSTHPPLPGAPFPLPFRLFAKRHAHPLTYSLHPPPFSVISVCFVPALCIPFYQFPLHSYSLGFPLRLWFHQAPSHVENHTRKIQR